jgi:hypothetical protein
MYLKKTMNKKTYFFVGILKLLTKGSGTEPNPDLESKDSYPSQNITNPEH